MHTDYAKRVKRAFAAAVVLHILLLFVPTHWNRADTIGLASVRDPIVFRLEEPEKPLRLIDTVEPATQPVDEETDLISERASNASDVVARDGARRAPHFSEPSDFDRMPKPELPAAPRPSPATDAQPEPMPPAPDASAGDSPEPVTETAATAIEGEPVEPEPPRPPMQVAQAEGEPSAPQDAQEARGRVDGGVRDAKGFVGFEAQQHEFAAYLRDVQRSVERRWKALIQLRYSGSKPTRVVLDCAITPHGMLESVTVVETGDSPSFAPLCKEAIETAAPFPPFPFAVPAIYRSQNLEIRWSFSFLQR